MRGRVLSYVCLWLLITAVYVYAKSSRETGRARGVRATDPCTETKRFYQTKGFTQAVPSVAIEGTRLPVCSRSYTCCTREMEDQLSTQSVVDFENKVAEKSDSAKNRFSLSYNKFNVFFKELVENSKQSLHSLFNVTYGELYTENSAVFMNLFDELKLYYEGAVVDMNDIIDSFFTTLMQQVFKLLKPSYDIDDDYMQCIADNINTIQPFADMPEKLSNQLRRAFIAARTFVHGLEMGQQVMQKISKIYPTKECAKALMKMSYCPKCHGYTLVKPCRRMCLNVMKGCLCSLGDTSINNVWNRYIDSMMMLLDRLEGPFNIESVLEPIDVKISEAIMTLQENEDDITKTVFRECGSLAYRDNMTAFNPLGGMNLNLNFGMSYKPNSKDFKPLGEVPGLSDLDLSDLLSGMTSGPSQISKRSIDEDMDGDVAMKKRKNKNKRRRKKNRRTRRRRKGHKQRDVSGHKHNTRFTLMSGDRYRSPIIKPVPQTKLKALVREMRACANETKNFWRNLPVSICGDEAEAKDEDHCWDGKTMGKYSLAVMKDGPQNQIGNPEVSVNISQIPNSIIRQHVTVLHEVTEKLRQAYHGVDPTLVDNEDTIYDFEATVVEEEEVLTGSGDFSGEESGEEDVMSKNKKGVGRMPFNMANTEGLYVEDLEMWQIKLIEQVLREEVKPRTSLAEIQERLAQHPDVEASDTGKDKKTRKDKKNRKNKKPTTLNPKTRPKKIDDLPNEQNKKKTPTQRPVLDTSTTGRGSSIQFSTSVLFVVVTSAAYFCWSNNANLI